MKVHPPRSIDSWREFLVEIAIIVIGVALALGAEELLSDYHAGKEVAVVQESLNDELADSLFASLERINHAQCQQRTIERLDSLVHGPASEPIGDIQPGPVRLWGSAAWEAAVASGIVEEMEHDERRAYAQLFGVVRTMKDWNTRERELWAVVRAYSRTPPSTPEARHRLAEAVSQLRSLTSIMALAAKQFVDTARPLKLQLTPADLAELREPVRCAAS